MTMLHLFVFGVSKTPDKHEWTRWILNSLKLAWWLKGGDSVDTNAITITTTDSDDDDDDDFLRDKFIVMFPILFNISTL